jgi:ParB family chromosome partitioning protein
MKHNALGRGLSSLLKEEIVPIEGEKNTDWLHIDQLVIGALQPRKNFSNEKIKELANSIISKGLLQPIVVNKSISGKYQIIAGERRYRACKLAGISDIPVVIKNLSDKEVLEVALIENIQREELTAIEEAEGFEKLIKEFGYSQSDIAIAVGKSRSHVANLLRLNNLPESIKNMINMGQLSMGHARCLIGIDNAEELAIKMIENGLNVRQAEELTQKKNRKHSDKRSDGNLPNNTNEDFILLGHSLSEKFGIKVIVEDSWKGGKVIFHYSNLEELDSILGRLN